MRAKKLPGNEKATQKGTMNGGVRKREEGEKKRLLTEATHGGDSRWRLDAWRQPRVWRREEQRRGTKRRRREKRRRRAR